MEKANKEASKNKTSATGKTDNLIDSI